MSAHPPIRVCLALLSTGFLAPVVLAGPTQPAEVDRTAAERPQLAVYHADAQPVRLAYASAPTGPRTAMAAERRASEPATGADPVGAAGLRLDLSIGTLCFLGMGLWLVTRCCLDLSRTPTHTAG